MYTDTELMEQVDGDWFEAHADRLQSAFEKTKDHWWRLSNGWAEDWAWGKKPAPVQNPMMPWVRPSFAAFVHRQWAFEHRADVMESRFQRRYVMGSGWRMPREEPPLRTNVASRAYGGF